MVSNSQSPGFSRGFFTSDSLKWLGPAVLALCLLPFVAGLHGPFLLDDLPNLEGARAATGTFGEIVYAITHNDSGLLRRPLANLSFLVNNHLFGQDPFSYKLINLILHWLNSWLVWRLTVHVIGLLYPQRTLQFREISGLFIAALWAMHPMQVSSVLYVVQRMAEMSAFFSLLALLVFLHLAQKPMPKPRLNIGLRAGFVGAIIAFGILSKENAVLFPCFLIAIYLVSEKNERQRITKNASSRVLFAICSWIPIILGSLTLIIGFSRLTAGYTGREFNMADRVFTEPFVLFHYLGTMLIPNIHKMGLYVDDMPIHHADEPLAWLMLAIIIVLPFAAIAIRKRMPAISFSILWFLCAHLLESTILPLEIAFEHRNYLALLGPMFAAGYYFCNFLAASRVNSLRYVSLIPIVFLGSETSVRAHQWADGRLFLEQEVKNHPASPRAQNAAVELDIESGDLDAAVRRVKSVQALKPGLFWPLSLDFNLACGIPNYPISWERMEGQIDERPLDASIIGMLRYDANAYLTSSCKLVDPKRFDLFLTNVETIYQTKNMPPRVEEILVLRSYIARSRKQPDAVRYLLNSAVQANPEGVIALSDLAYFELNSGNVDAAEIAIGQLEARIKQWSPTRQFEIVELREFLTQAKKERAHSQ